MQSFSEVLNHTIHLFESIPGYLKPIVLLLFIFCFVVDSVFIVVKVGLDDLPLNRLIAKKIIQASFLTWLIINYTEFMRFLSRFAVESASVSAHVSKETLSPEQITQPGELVKLAFSVINQRLQLDLFHLSLQHVALFLLTLLMGLLLCVIAIEFAIIWIEFYLLVGIAILFVPFAAWDKTAFIFEKAVSIWIVFTTKILMISFFVALSWRYLIELPQRVSNDDLYGVLNVTLVLIVIAILLIKFNHLIVTLLHGGVGSQMNSMVTNLLTLSWVGMGVSKAGIYYANKIGEKASEGFEDATAAFHRFNFSNYYSEPSKKSVPHSHQVKEKEE